LRKIIAIIKEVSAVTEFQEKYIQKNLSRIINIILGTSAFVSIISPFLFKTMHITYVTLFAVISCLFLKLLTKKDYYTLSGILTGLLLIIIANISLYIGRGFRDEAMLIFPGIIVLTSLILNRRYFILFTTFSILNVLVIGLLEINGIFVHDFSKYTLFGEVLDACAILTATGIGVYILNSNLLHISQRASQSEFQFQSFFNSSPEGIFVMDLNGIIKNVNRSLLNIFDVDESKVVNKSFQEFIDETEVPKIKKIIADLISGISGDVPIEIKINTSKETSVPVSIKGFLVRDPKSRPVALGAFIEDISEKKKLLKEKTSLQDQLTHVQKIEAIGTLAGGIAHDFNNILVGILGFTELAIVRENDEKISSYLSKVQHAGNRAKGLVEQILKFSRRETGEFRPVSINSILNEVLKLLGSSLPVTISINKQIELEKDLINGDETQIHQVLMNLCTNAYQAMKNKSGTLSIHVVNYKSTEARKYLNMQILPGDYIRISITDNGIGMTDDVLERIFEPYFTTKKVKEGTGLGLSVTMGIIQSHHGLIEVESTPDVGTTFTIFLPELKKEPVKQDIPKSVSFNGNNENILILDDEYYFTDVMQGFLKGMNLNPMAFNNSHEALAHIKSNPDLYQGIITDLTMPNMDGLEFISEVRNINSSIPIILCTGFSEEVTQETASYYGITKFLNKPVSKRDISAALQEILNE
jgi:PAS domain S-box-containing protein